MISSITIFHIKFQSTPSPRRETNENRIVCKNTCISIHSLPKEGDSIETAVSKKIINFNPLPPQGGRLGETAKEEFIKAISIHSLPKEGDRHVTTLRIYAKNFNPLPPQGGRPIIVSTAPAH